VNGHVGDVAYALLADILQKLESKMNESERRALVRGTNDVVLGGLSKSEIWQIVDTATCLADVVEARSKEESLALSGSVCVPPHNAEFLFHILMEPKSADAIIGDLEERYRYLLKRFGRGRANFWYWFQTFISLRPIIWAFMKKPLAAAASMAAAHGIIKHDGWIATLIEFVKRVRP
jgi:hypothetical protein